MSLLRVICNCVLQIIESDRLSEIELITLIGATSDIAQRCFFASEEEVFDMLAAVGITSASLSREEASVEGKGCKLITMHCPLPLGNPFLIRYHLHESGSGMHYCSFCDRSIHYEAVLDGRGLHM